jgi:hypothetical protein
MNEAFTGSAKIKVRHTPACHRCDVPMKEGSALVNGYSGSPDFAGDQSGIMTISADPKKVAMVSCWKCPKCGHSISRKEPVAVADRPALMDKASRKWWKQPATPHDLMRM